VIPDTLPIRYVPADRDLAESIVVHRSHGVTDHSCSHERQGAPGRVTAHCCHDIGGQDLNIPNVRLPLVTVTHTTTMSASRCYHKTDFGTHLYTEPMTARRATAYISDATQQIMSENNLSLSDLIHIGADMAHAVNGWGPETKKVLERIADQGDVEGKGWIIIGLPWSYAEPNAGPNSWMEGPMDSPKVGHIEAQLDDMVLMTTGLLCNTPHGEWWIPYSSIQYVRPVDRRLDRWPTAPANRAPGGREIPS